MPDTPAAEFVIDEPLIRALLAEQAPELADLELRLVASGWDNEMWRLGPDLAVRVPRRQVAVDLIESEHRWLPELAPSLPLPVPVPVVAGQPSATHPRPWSVVPWFAGSPLADRPATDAMVDDLARFLVALHRPAPADAPRNDWRGVPLGDRAPQVAGAVEAVRGRGEGELATRIEARWSRLIASPTYSGPAVWLHGDLHSFNLLVTDEVIAAVIDFGDLTSGDPASDLAVAWMALDAPQRHRFRAAMSHIDDATWARAQGWALAIGTIVLVNADDDPLLAATARTAVDRVLADDVPGSG